MDHRRVLIIDADRRTVDKLQELFVRSGFEAEVALSPSVGLNIIMERQMSVAVMSAEVGSDENWAMVKRMKQTDPGLPLVLFNTPKDKLVSKEAKRAGVRRCITTPIDVRTVHKEAVKMVRN